MLDTKSGAVSVSRFARYLIETFPTLYNSWGDSWGRLGAETETQECYWRCEENPRKCPRTKSFPPGTPGGQKILGSGKIKCHPRPTSPLASTGQSKQTV